MPVPLLSATDDPRRWGFGAALDDRLFRLAVGPGRELSIETAPLEPGRVNTASNPEELAETEPTFSRSRFSGGEGLFRAHVEGAAPDRFWDSRNVSVAPAEPGEFPEIRLLHTTAVIEPSTDVGLRSAYNDIGGALYVCEGTVLRRSTNPNAATPTFADDNPHNGEVATTVSDVTVLGDEVYAALGTNGIHRRSSGTWSHWSDTAATRVWDSKGRIVASDGRSLYEVVAAGAAPSALKTLAPGDSWTDVADGGSHILCAATDGYVYSFTTESGSMALSAQTLFEGETPRCVGQTQGIVAIGTSSGNIGRLYVGEVNPDNGQLVGLQLVKQFGNADTATDQSPRLIIGTRASLFCATTDGADTFLWRYDVTTDGLSRSFTVEGSSGTPRGLHVIGGKAFVTVDGHGVFRQTSTYASEGSLIGPLGDFVSASDKSWIGARLETGALTSGMAVEFYYTRSPSALGDPDSSAWTRIVRRTTGSGDPGEIPLAGVVARSLAGMVKLVPTTDALDTPAVRSFGFRAYPSSGDEDVIVTLPVNVGDQIERRGLARRRVSGLGERAWADLMEFDASTVTLRLFKPEVTVRGLVEAIGTPVQAITSRGSSTLVSQVRVKGRKVPVGATGTTGSGPFGTYRLFGTLPTFGEVA